jgi:ABC-type transporter MlaC component
MKIIDVVVGGVSVELTERREFASVVQQTAIDGLIGTLRSRVNDLPQAEATQD